MLRRLQATGASGAGQGMAASLHLHGSLQMAVGQRVTAFHPKDRHVYTGTVLTPDGDHYKIQFDQTKQGVQAVLDMLVAPLLDGSRGIDFTSPRCLNPDGSGFGSDGLESRPRLMAESSSTIQPAMRELQLCAYIDRLLDRFELLLQELKKVSYFSPMHAYTHTHAHAHKHAHTCTCMYRPPCRAAPRRAVRSKARSLPSSAGADRV